jgi:soluble lytic murein transglycosylase-like protein
LIYRTALREGIDPDLAFRVVRVESGFKATATSSAGALGLAQVQLPTARFYDAHITAEQLYDPATNLSIGFRYLRDLIEVYGDVKHALLAYNRGPSRLKKLLDEGRDPQNGYASRIMEGYAGVESR